MQTKLYVPTKDGNSHDTTRKHGEKRCKRTTAHRGINGLRVEREIVQIPSTYPRPSPFIVPESHQTTDRPPAHLCARHTEMQEIHK